MAKDNLKLVVDKLKKFNGVSVFIKIKHQLYGDQSIQCAFQLINDEERLGFSVNEQEIFIYKSHICNFGRNDGSYYFADDVMRIEIRKTTMAV